MIKKEEMYYVAMKVADFSQDELAAEYLWAEKAQMPEHKVDITLYGGEIGERLLIVRGHAITTGEILSRESKESPYSAMYNDFQIILNNKNDVKVAIEEGQYENASVTVTLRAGSRTLTLTGETTIRYEKSSFFVKEDSAYAGIDLSVNENDEPYFRQFVMDDGEKFVYDSTKPMTLKY